MGVWKEVGWAWPPGVGESWWGLTGNGMEGERREMGSARAKGVHLIGDEMSRNERKEKLHLSNRVKDRKQMSM